MTERLAPSSADGSGVWILGRFLWGLWALSWGQWVDPRLGPLAGLWHVMDTCLCSYLGGSWSSSLGYISVSETPQSRFLSVSCPITNPLRGLSPETPAHLPLCRSTVWVAV